MQTIETISGIHNREISLAGERGKYAIIIREPGRQTCMFIFQTKARALKEFNKHKQLVKHIIR